MSRSSFIFVSLLISFEIYLIVQFEFKVALATKMENELRQEIDEL